MNAFVDAIAWILSGVQVPGAPTIPEAFAQQLAYTFGSVVVAAVVAVPLGWLIGHTGRGRDVAVAISGAARAIPSFGLLILLVLVMGVLHKPEAAVITFVVLAIPSLLSGAYSGLEAIDRSTIDAARATGMTEWQILWRVEVPLGLPLLVAGFRAATLQVVATVTIAAYVGLGGLGQYIITGLPLRRIDMVLGGAILVAALALVLDGLFAALQRAVVPRGVRLDRPRRPNPSAAPTENLAPPQREKKTMSTRMTRLAGLGAAVTAAALVLAGCASSNPLAPETGDGTPSSDTIVIGSQAYYSNEIIAEIYAQALEGAGFTVDRQFNIGQRDAYLPEIESGAITLFPEYSGNLLQFFEPDTTARTPDDVYAALQDALPSNLTVLDQSTASDQDSYTVTSAFASQYGLESIADLSKVTVPLVLGGPPELAERPYGPTGLKDTYGVDVTFQPTGDTTVEDLVAGTVNVANVFTADPSIQTQDLVVLDDPEGLFLASNVVPLVNKDVADDIADVINEVSAALTPEGLVALNVQSTVDQKSAAQIATQWLQDNDLS